MKIPDDSGFFSSGNLTIEFVFLRPKQARRFCKCVLPRCSSPHFWTSLSVTVCKASLMRLLSNAGTEGSASHTMPGLIELL
ncbi:MAG: hypothetical protein V4489_10400, partial [Chlamydiota bacterium]